MKRFLRTLLCIFIGGTAASATDVSFRLTDFALNPSTNRTVWVQPMSVPTATSASVVIGQRIIAVTDTNGSFTISNVAPMLYQCSVQAPPQQTLFKILVTATNLGTVNAHDIMVADGTSTFPAGAVAWSAVVSDNRYARSTNSTASLTSGTTGLSVSGGSGAVLGSGTTLTITNLPQSQILNLVSDLGLKLPSDSTNQLVSTNVFILFTNAIYQFALTNVGSGGVSVAAGSLVTVSTNGTLATVAAVQQTNGLSLSAFLSPASLTNGFTDRSTVTNIARSITNGLATVSYVQSATNGYTSITTSNANAFARTNDDRLVYFGNTSSVFAGVTTNGINVGSAFSSPGSGSPSEQFGAGAVASGISSTAVGVGAEASGNIGASAFGHTSQATAGNSTAFGQFARANEINATAFGRASLATGVNSTAIGSSSQATNSGSFALGASALSTGANSLAIGRGASAVHDNSMVFGASVTSTVENQITFGDNSQYVLFPGNGTVAGTWTNGQVVLTNLIGDRNPIIIGTTNVIWMEDIGLSYFTNGAPYVWNGNNWSNQYNAAAIIFQNPTYFLRHGGTNFYSSSTPAGSSWSLVNGIAPAPTTGYGSYVRMNGLVFIGRHSDTNLEALIRAATNGLQLTAFLTPSQLTNGLVTATITNGLATTNYVTSQGYVTATVTNGLATVTYASNLVLVTSNGISARITGFNTNDYRPGSGITFSTNTPGIIQVNNALALSGSGIVTNGGSGTNNILVQPTILSAPLIQVTNLLVRGAADFSQTSITNLKSIQFAQITGSEIIESLDASNRIGGAGIAFGAQYSGILFGKTNMMYGDVFNIQQSAIVAGASNIMRGDAGAIIDSAIIGGGRNQLRSGMATDGGGTIQRAGIYNSANSIITNRGNSSVVSNIIVLGGHNLYSDASMVTIAGNNGRVTNNSVFMWSDDQSATFTSTTNRQFLVRAQNGMVVQGPISPSEYRLGASPIGVSTNWIFASGSGARLNSDVYNTSSSNVGSNDYPVLQSILDSVTNRTSLTLIIDGAALIDSGKALSIHSNTTIIFPNPKCGVVLGVSNNCPIFQNANLNTNYSTLNISIIGGTINQNGQYQAALCYTNSNDCAPHGTNGFVCGMQFLGVSNLLIQGTTIINPRVYAILYACVDNAVFDGVTWDYQFKGGCGQDGLHLIGASKRVFIYNCSGNGVGDNLAFNLNEVQEWGVSSYWPRSTDDLRLSHLWIDGVYLWQRPGVVFSGDSMSVLNLQGGTINSLTVKNVRAERIMAPIRLATSRLGDMTLEDWQLPSIESPAGYIGLVASNLVVRNFFIRPTQAYDPPYGVFVIGDEGQTNAGPQTYSGITADLRAMTGSGAGLFVVDGHATNIITVNDITQAGGDAVFQNLGTESPLIKVSNINSGGAPVNYGGSLTNIFGDAVGPQFYRTNWVSGFPYTQNFADTSIRVIGEAIGTSGAANGTVRMDLVVDGRRAGSLLQGTTTSSLVVTNGAIMSATVPYGSTFYFTNLSAGAGNSTALLNESSGLER